MSYFTYGERDDGFYDGSEYEKDGTVTYVYQYVYRLTSYRPFGYIHFQPPTNEVPEGPNDGFAQAQNSCMDTNSG